LDHALQALACGVAVAHADLVALLEEPRGLGEAVLFTRWRSDCLGWATGTRGRRRIYWRRGPIRSASLSEVVREPCHGVIVPFSGVTRPLRRLGTAAYGDGWRQR